MMANDSYYIEPSLMQWLLSGMIWMIFDFWDIWQCLETSFCGEEGRALRQGLPVASASLELPM